MALWARSKLHRVREIPKQIPASVSVVSEFPEDLYDAMRDFVLTHSQWDRYRLMQASLAGFLFQHGSKNQAVSRHYLDDLFRREASQQKVSATDAIRDPLPAQPCGVVAITDSQRLPQAGSFPTAA